MIRVALMKPLRALALVAASLLAATVFPSVAQAQNGNVDVDINLTGGITILYYYSDIDVTIDVAQLFNAAANCTASGGTSGTVGTANVPGCSVTSPAGVAATGTAAGGLTATFAAPSPAAVNLSAVNLTLQNVWAVRALGGDTNATTMGVVVPAGTTIAKGTASSIGVTGASITPANFTDPGLVTPVTGSINLTLDFTNTDEGGAHGGADTGDTVYTIQVTNT